MGRAGFLPGSGGASVIAVLAFIQLSPLRLAHDSPAFHTHRRPVFTCQKCSGIWGSNKRGYHLYNKQSHIPLRL